MRPEPMYGDKIKLPKLRVPEARKFREILSFLIAKTEFEIDELHSTVVSQIAVKWKKNTLTYLKYKRAAYVQLDRVIEQQKDYGDGESGL